MALVPIKAMAVVADTLPVEDRSASPAGIVLLGDGEGPAQAFISAI